MKNIVASFTIVALLTLFVPNFSEPVQAYDHGLGYTYDCYTYWPESHVITFTGQQHAPAVGPADYCEVGHNAVTTMDISTKIDFTCTSGVYPYAGSSFGGVSVYQCAQPVEAYSVTNTHQIPSEPPNPSAHVHDGAWTWASLWLAADPGVTRGVSFWMLCDGSWSVAGWNVDFPC
jgi:hypothetical protein